MNAGKTCYNGSTVAAGGQADSRFGDQILSVLTAAGRPAPERWRGERAPVRCPLPSHGSEDRHPSAWIDVSIGCFGCSACGVRYGAKKLAEALGVPWPPPHGTYTPQPSPKQGKTDTPPDFTPAEAQRTWNLALARARDDDAVEADRPVYDYIQKRGVADAWEDCYFGIVPPNRDDRLPWQVRWWGPRGWRVVLPLYAMDGDNAGKIVAVQARHIDFPPRGNRKRLLFPKGSHIRKTAFANRRALAMLDRATDAKRVIVVEGMFDFLTAALAHDDLPVLGAPGAGQTKNVIGTWARGREVVLAPHPDDAGMKQLPYAIAAVQRMGGRAFVAHVQRREARVA